MTDALIRELLPFLNSEDTNCSTGPLCRLSVGGNNQTFRFDHNGSRYFVKRYFTHPTDLRDRQGNEQRFITLLQEQNIPSIAKLIAIDSQSHVSIFEFVEGSKLSPQAIADGHIDLLAQFFTSVNSIRTKPEAQSLQIASEGFFTLAEHLQCIDKRITRLQGIQESSHLLKKAKAIVLQQIIPLWTKVKQQLSDNASRHQAAWAELTENASARCLSPSDFGFHNAILTPSGELVFVDFEYSGWDDPAKTICDLFWQVASPISLEQCRRFYGEILEPFPNPASLAERVQLLLPVFGIKWCCIVLNHFTAQDRLRKEFSDEQAHSENILDQQLHKAVTIIARLQAKDYEYLMGPL